MNVRLKRARELAGYAVQLTKDEGLPTMLKRGAGFVKRRCFGKRARYLPAKKVLEAQRAEMADKTAADCGLPTISILTPLYNTPENYLREFLDSFVGQTAPNGQLCLADASDDAHPEVERIVREYQQKNQRIGYKKVENKGIAANTNAAEALADGEYLALADHDDVLANGVWQQFFTEKPEVLTREEKRAWLDTLKGVSLGSDAFFPFGDNIERAHKSGVDYIAQAGGSVRDDHVIETCDKYGIAMSFTGIRLFHH